MFCENCGKQIDDSAKFCEHCGSKVEQAVTENHSEVVETTVPGIVDGGEVVTAVKKPFNVKIIALVAVVVIAVVAVFGLGKLVLGMLGGGSSDYALIYSTEDGEYKFLKSGKKEGVEIKYTKDGIDNIVQKSDGSGAYFRNYEGNLYYIDFNAATKDENYRPDKIASNTYGPLDIWEDKYVFFMKDSNLYMYDGKEDKKLKADLNDYYIRDGKIIAYDYDGRLYVIDAKDTSKEVKVDSNIRDVLYVADDLSEIIYTKYGNYDEQTNGEIDIYVSDASGKSEKIASSAQNVFTGNDGTVYYSFGNGETSSFLDYVEDPYYAEDEEAEYPDSDDYYYDYYDFGDFDDYHDYLNSTQYEQHDAAYEAARKEYYQKQYRNNLRDNLIDEDFSTETVYAYIDGKSKELSKASTMFDVCGDAIIVNSVDAGKVATMDELYTIYDEEGYYSAYNLLREKLNGTGTTDVYINGDEKINVGDLTNNVSNLEYFYVLDNDNVAFIIYDEEAGENMVYVGKVKNGKLPSEPIATDAYIARISDDGGVIYYEGSYDKNTAYIYKDGKTTELGEYISIDSICEGADGSILYIADYSTRSYTGVLTLYENGKMTEICDDVKPNAYRFLGDEIYYVESGRSSDYYGDLYQFKGAKKEPLLIEEDAALW